MLVHTLNAFSFPFECSKHASSIVHESVMYSLCLYDNRFDLLLFQGWCMWESVLCLYANCFDLFLFLYSLCLYDNCFDLFLFLYSLCLYDSCFDLLLFQGWWLWNQNGCLSSCPTTVSTPSPWTIPRLTTTLRKVM